MYRSFQLCIKSLPTLKHTDMGQNKRTNQCHYIPLLMTYMLDQSEMIFSQFKVKLIVNEYSQP